MRSESTQRVRESIEKHVKKEADQQRRMGVVNPDKKALRKEWEKSAEMNDRKRN